MYLLKIKCTEDCNRWSDERIEMKSRRSLLFKSRETSRCFEFVSARYLFRISKHLFIKRGTLHISDEIRTNRKYHYFEQIQNGNWQGRIYTMWRAKTWPILLQWLVRFSMPQREMTLIQNVYLIGFLGLNKKVHLRGKSNGWIHDVSFAKLCLEELQCSNTFHTTVIPLMMP